MLQQLQQPAKSTGGQPAWVVYDQNLRQEAASNPSQSWEKIDPSIYSQCFLDMAKSAEGWCHTCQSLDHTSDNFAQVPVAVQPASNPGRQSQGNRENLHSSQLVSSTTGIMEWWRVSFWCKMSLHALLQQMERESPSQALSLGYNLLKGEKHEALTSTHWWLVILVNSCCGYVSPIIYPAHCKCWVAMLSWVSLRCQTAEGGGSPITCIHITVGCSQRVGQLHISPPFS